MIAEKIEFLIGEKAREVVQNFPETFAQFVRNEVRAVYEGIEEGGQNVIENDIETGLLDMKKMSAEGDLAVATEGGKPVAMIGLQIGGRLEDGRKVYSVHLAYTDPKFRGKEIYSQLRSFLLEKWMRNTEILYWKAVPKVQQW
ncbi:hypothetical protein HC823_00790 [Candidatus Gracilibacteria bacterium]|nr:hypothetical protein [Candidatus Gracilibacteria bacterium]